MRIPNTCLHNVFTLAIAFFCFVFPQWKKDEYRRNNRCMKSYYQETLTNMIWRRRQDKTHFTGMCSMTLSVSGICISLWWIMFTLQCNLQGQDTRTKNPSKPLNMVRDIKRTRREVKEVTWTDLLNQRSMFLAQRSQLDTEESTGSIDKTKGP